MSKPNKRHAERRSKKIGSSKLFSAKKALKKQEKKKADNVKRGRRGQKIVARKII